MVRRVRAECCSTAFQVTGTPHKFQGLPVGARAVHRSPTVPLSNYFLSHLRPSPA